MLPSSLARQLEQALRGLRYGSVQLVIHDAQVVRIERIERLKLTVSTEALLTQTTEPTTSMEARREHDREA